jgi:hypothetical protein
MMVAVSAGYTTPIAATPSSDASAISPVILCLMVIMVILCEDPVDRYPECEKNGSYQGRKKKMHRSAVGTK